MKNAKDYMVSNVPNQSVSGMSAECYQLQLQISEFILKDLVFGIIRDIDSMNDAICVGLEESREDGRTIKRRWSRERKETKSKWIWCK